MKKFFLWLLSALLLVSLAGCKSEQQQPDGTNNSLNTNVSQNTVTQKKENKEDQQYTVAENTIAKGSFSISLPTEITEPFASVFKNTKSFYFEKRSKNITISDYQKTFWKFAVVDMDFDGNNEVVVMLDDGNIFILHQDNESVYGHEFGPHTMYQINKDGTFLWNRNSGNIYGCSMLRFTANNVETTELWRVEYNEANSFTFYIDNKLVSKEQFDAMDQQRNLESVDWIPWIDSP